MNCDWGSCQDQATHRLAHVRQVDNSVVEIRSMCAYHANWTLEIGAGKYGYYRLAGYYGELVDA